MDFRHKAQRWTPGSLLGKGACCQVRGVWGQTCHPAQGLPLLQWPLAKGMPRAEAWPPGWMRDVLLDDTHSWAPYSQPGSIRFTYSSASPSAHSCFCLITLSRCWSLINNWHPELYLRICFWRTQPETLVIYDLTNNQKQGYPMGITDTVEQKRNATTFR